MLIRTQDKRSLVDITGLRITINQYVRLEGTLNQFYVYNVEYSGGTLGRYSTFEKAMKVLDMIQEEYKVELYKNKVFEMPLDEEVSV